MVKLKKSNKKITPLEVNRNEFLRLVPIISPYATIKKKKSDSLLIELNISEFKKRKLLDKIIPTPNYKKIQLDKLGMELFLLCDGNHKIKEIISIFQENYRLTESETELSVKKYLLTLTKKDLIGYLIPKDIIKKNKLDANKIKQVVITS